MQESVPRDMLSIFKKLFGKTPESAPAPPSTAPAPTIAAPAPAPTGPPADAIAVSLKSVVATMPDNLKGRLDKKLTGSELIHLRRDDVMRQLATGAVKIPFSEVVSMAPNTFLTPTPDMLGTPVNVPLQEILPKIKALPRRAAQKVVEVPEDLAPVFGVGQAAPKPVEVAPVVSAPTAPPPPPTPVAPPPPPPPPAPTPAPVVKEEVYVAPAPKPMEPEVLISMKPPVAPVVAPAETPVPPKPASDQPTLGFGDIFGQPDKANWTPQEIVDKASTLRGIAGALITTVDGLPVAFHLPDNLSGNLVAAFVPQMYTRIVQYTRDLKLGEAKHLTILIENVPLQIFKSGNFYFTVLGRANEALPKPQLTAISAALARQGQT